MTDDTISRKTAIKAIQDLYPAMPRIDFGDNISNWQQKYRQYIECENVIRILPSAERKKGRWISLDDFRGKYNDRGYKCSECDEHSDYEENFCPNCGAEMIGDTNGGSD